MPSAGGAMGCRRRGESAMVAGIWLATRSATAWGSSASLAVSVPHCVSVSSGRWIAAWCVAFFAATGALMLPGWVWIWATAPLRASSQDAEEARVGPVEDGTQLGSTVEALWPRTVVQTCIVHLIRKSIRYVARQDWDKSLGTSAPVYTAPSEAAAAER